MFITCYEDIDEASVLHEAQRKGSVRVLRWVQSSFEFLPPNVIVGLTITEDTLPEELGGVNRFRRRVMAQLAGRIGPLLRAG